MVDKFIYNMYIILLTPPPKLSNTPDTRMYGFSESFQSAQEHPSPQVF